jgi:hypothetical protein
LAFLVQSGCSPAEPVETPDTGDESVWTTAAPVPDARTEVSVTTDGQRIWLIGGFAAGPGGATAPRAMHVYDPAANAWTTPGSIPEGVNHAGFAHVDGRLYVLGGFREASFTPCGAVRIYHIASGMWSEGALLSTAASTSSAETLRMRDHWGTTTMWVATTARSGHTKCTILRPTSGRSARRCR